MGTDAGLAALAPPAAPVAGVVSPGARVAAVVGAHAAVDFYSALIIPLITVLEGRLGLSPARGALLIGLGSVCSGLIQPLVALVSDRLGTRAFGWLGLVAAAVAISLVGHASTFGQLVMLQVVGMAGVGAFHPVGAAAIGQLAARRRSAGVAVFFSMGIVGGVSGSFASPWFVRAFGLGAMAWLMIGGLIVAALLFRSLRGMEARSPGAHREHAALPAPERRARWRAVGLLYVGNVLRFMVNLALVTILVRWCEAHALAKAAAASLTPEVRLLASQVNGPLQGGMLLGMGLGGLVLGVVVSRHVEKAALLWTPLLCAGAIAAIPHTPWPAAVFALAVASGVGFAGVMPITISLAQRLLPHRTNLASGLMMGGAWGLGALGPLLAQGVIDAPWGGLGVAGWVVAGLLALAGVMAALLPGSVLRSAGS
ncbi:MAG: MFS transporter [Phycisphaerae bacterium]|nr:MFS transporter [Phycisphaerae bacterium]